jgi:hypothetical protein
VRAVSAECPVMVTIMSEVGPPFPPVAVLSRLVVASESPAQAGLGDRWRGTLRPFGLKLEALEPGQRPGPPARRTASAGSSPAGQGDREQPCRPVAAAASRPGAQHAA